MSFKYLNTANNSNSLNQENAAQSFLDDKLSKNRFTIKQQETLDANGGPKDFSSQYNKVISNQDEIDAAKTHNASLKKNKLSAEQIREKFGFSYNEDHASNGGGFSGYGGRDDGAIYNKTTGEYIGSIDNFTPRTGKSDRKRAQGIDSFEAVEDYAVQHGLRNNKRSNWNSMNDVSGAVNDVVGENPVDKVVPAEKTDLIKIEHSPEIKQAKERVKTYEDDVLSGKVSEDVYKVGSNDQYTFDATKGAAGIGTPMNGSSLEQAYKATASFLDNKKSQVKDKYQIFAA